MGDARRAGSGDAAVAKLTLADHHSIATMLMHMTVVVDAMPALGGLHLLASGHGSASRTLRLEPARLETSAKEEDAYVERKEMFQGVVRLQGARMRRRQDVARSVADPTVILRDADDTITRFDPPVGRNVHQE